MMLLKLFVWLTGLFFVSSVMAATTTAPKDLKDLYFGEALYYAFQEEWFEAIARLDIELRQFHRLDEPELDSLFSHLGQAEFGVGDFELAYRMHHRAGRAITAVIEGNVEEQVRNEAIFRLARIYFQKDQPQNALQAVERIRGAVPVRIRDDLAFLRAQILMANGRFAEAARAFRELQSADSLEGFTTYNLGIALLANGNKQEGRQFLDRTGQLSSSRSETLAIKDKSNLVLGYKLLEEDQPEAAGQFLDRVRLQGPFSNRALLGSGWANSFQERYERALVPWSILIQREVTDPAVQEAMLAVPYAYAKLGVHSRAALMYGSALEAFGQEIEKLSSSIMSIREGNFLRALEREELKQDANWVVKLRSLPATPETYYLLELMASHDFQESLKNYLDLEGLRRKLVIWEGDLAAFEEIIQHRLLYYQPLLPEVDREFRSLDSQMRLRLEQRDRIEQRLQAMLVSPRPDYLATAEERLVTEQITALEHRLAAGDAGIPPELEARINRLKGVLHWHSQTEYDQRLTAAHKNLRELDQILAHLKARYTAFVRTRQAATQSYEGYDEVIRRQRLRILAAQEAVRVLMARQGHMLETMAVNELSKRRERLEEFQVKARFAMADSYDRATKAQAQELIGK
jgi:hypothetical protein